MTANATHIHDWHPYVSENLLRCDCGATARDGRVVERERADTATATDQTQANHDAIDRALAARRANRTATR